MGPTVPSISQCPGLRDSPSASSLPGSQRGSMPLTCTGTAPLCSSCRHVALTWGGLSTGNCFTFFHETVKPSQLLLWVPVTMQAVPLLYASSSITAPLSGNLVPVQGKGRTLGRPPVPCPLMCSFFDQAHHSQPQFCTMSPLSGQQTACPRT